MAELHDKPTKQLTIPIVNQQNILYADLTPFQTALRQHGDDAIYHLEPSHDNRLSYLRFATQVFSQLVILGKPCVDVLIHRKTPSSTIAHPPRTTLTPSPHLVPVDAKDYKFGDGDFYNKYTVTCVGGTFDRLHAGHRLLLTAAAWASRETLRIGITSDNLLQHKKHYDLIASFEHRSHSAEDYARRVKPSLRNITISALHDPAGPSATDGDIEAIVVSKETATGARKINDVREGSGLKRMSIIEVDILDTQQQKLSSSALREEEARRLK